MREGGGQDVYCLREIFFLENKLNSTNIKICRYKVKIFRQQTKQIKIQKQQNKRIKNTNAIIYVVSTKVKKAKKIEISSYRQRALDITLTANELR